MNATPWDDEHPDIDLLTKAVAAGITVEQITAIAGEGRLRYGHRISNSDHRRISDLVHDREYRSQKLDELAHLAGCLGHDPADKRAKADAKLTNAGLDQMVRDLYAYARRQGVDVRTPAEKQAAQDAQDLPATDRQVQFIADLLTQRIRSGEGGGFMDVESLLVKRGPVNGPAVNLDAVRALTRREASLTITSLKGEY